MNVLFHTTTAIGIAVLLTDTKSIENSSNKTRIAITSVFAFLVGIISHGVLDYVPHCYPINSKIDVIIGVLIILLSIYFTNKKYWLIVGLAFLGCIFPDIIDLSIPILNKQFGFNLPTMEKIFPWHWPEYSGSIYNINCNVSSFNHLLLFLVVIIICLCRLTDLKAMIKK